MQIKKKIGSPQNAQKPNNTLLKPAEILRFQTPRSFTFSPTSTKEGSVPQSSENTSNSSLASSVSYRSNLVVKQCSNPVKAQKVTKPLRSTSARAKAILVTTMKQHLFTLKTERERIEQRLSSNQQRLKEKTLENKYLGSTLEGYISMDNSMLRHRGKSCSCDSQCAVF